MGKARVLRQHREMGDGVFCVLLGDAHLLPVGGAAADGGVHREVLLPEAPVDDGLVLPGKGVGLDLLRQPLVGLVVFRHHQQAAGVLVDAVDDAGADHPVDAGKGALAVVQQGVHQGAGVVPRGGVDHHPLGLVDHQQPVVLVDDIQGDVLRQHLQFHRVGEGDRHHVPGAEQLLFPRRPAVDQHPAALAKALGGGAAQFLQLPGDGLVQPLVLLPGGKGQLSHGGSLAWAALGSPSARGCFPSMNRM